MMLHPYTPQPMALPSIKPAHPSSVQTITAQLLKALKALQIIHLS